MGKITVYTKPGCVQCKMTKKFLSDHDVSFEEKNVGADEQAIEYLRNLGYQKLPVVMQDDEQNAITGFRPDALRKFI